MTDGAIILLGSYAAWAGGAFAVVYGDLARHEPQDPERWGLAQWGAISFVAGGLALPFYFSNTRGTSEGLVRGILLGIGVAVLALVVRVGLSAAFRVPVL